MLLNDSTTVGHLVVGGDLDLLVEIAARDPPRALGERLDRQHQAAGEEEPHPGGGEQDEQRHEHEHQPVAGGEIALLHLELAVGLVGLDAAPRSGRR